MRDKRWLRIIPVALIMYTISYIDRTNVALAMDPKISTMLQDLGMGDKLKGIAGGIFFFGYVLLQIPGGHLAHHWSARKLVSIFLVLWGICAVGCGFVSNFNQFAIMRFLLGVAESGVFPATLVLLANWFPRAERARANGYWNLCQPLAVVASAPLSGWILDTWANTSLAQAHHIQSWRVMLVVEGALPFLWLPIWLYFISDHPREAKWLPAEERNHLEAALAKEHAELSAGDKLPLWQVLMRPAILVMIPIYFLQNCAAYGCNTFLTASFDQKGYTFNGIQRGALFAIPYCVAVVVMIWNAWHSDKTRERRGHVALVYGISGVSLILSVLLKEHSFWLSYAFLCLAIPGPFAGLAPFWAIPSETLPRSVIGALMGLVNAIGNVGGFAGPYLVGWMKERTGGITLPFSALGGCLILAAALCFLLPRARVLSSAVAQPAEARRS